MQTKNQLLVRTGKTGRPGITLGEVLNCIDTADRRQSRILLEAMRSRRWYVPNQLDHAFAQVQTVKTGRAS
jgi:hypothetical protein